MENEQEQPKIQIDSDWKAEAQAEKQRLSEQQSEDEGAAGQGQMPAANFETLVSTIATQALFAMGAIPDPRTGQPVQQLELARHHVDMLSVIEEKTRGNLSEEETKLITGTQYEVLSRDIQMSSGGRPSM